MTIIRYAIAIVLAAALAGCGLSLGGDAEGQASPAGIPTERTYDVELRHANGLLKERGDLDASGRPEGEWRFWDASGQRRFVLSFRAGAVAADEPWIVYDAQGLVEASSERGDAMPAPPVPSVR